MLQGLVRGVVGAKFRIKVAENSDANGITHGSIVLERVLAETANSFQISSSAGFATAADGLDKVSEREEYIETK
jgi:hypothetical protein